MLRRLTRFPIQFSYFKKQLYCNLSDTDTVHKDNNNNNNNKKIEKKEKKEEIFEYYNNNKDHPIVGDNTSVKTLYNIIKKGKKPVFNGHYHNLLVSYKGLRGKTKLSLTPPYHTEKSWLFDFVIERKIIQKSILSSLKVKIERSNVRAEGKLIGVKGSDASITFPKLPLDFQKNPSILGLDQSGSGLLDFHFLQSYRSCYKRNIKSIELGKNASLEIGYGVFPPTRRDYIKLFDQVFSKWCRDNRREIASKQQQFTVLDVGCGSGILGFLVNNLLTSITSVKPYTLGVDKFHEAIRCSTLNAKKLEYSRCFYTQSEDTLFPILTDKPNSIAKVPLTRHVSALKDNKYDIIICNPPWIPIESSKEDIESHSSSYVYDSNVIENLLVNADKHLKEGGRLFLVYSNFSQLLGKTSETYISDLCSSNNLQVLKIFETQSRVKYSETDWFAEIKAETKVHLYEIASTKDKTLSVLNDNLSNF